jgi:outer membrane receptor protein involved in Fe transport
LRTTLGIPGINIASDSLTSGAPGFNIADADRSGNQGPNNPTGGGAQYGSALNITRCNCPLIEREDQFQLVNNWTKLFGNHAYKFGVDLRYGRNLRVPSDSDRAGILSFDPGPTSNGGSTAGLGMASFLLGDVSSFQRYVSVSTNAKEFQKRDFFYAQDTWRPRPSLTINYGLRYEMYFPESVNGKGNGALMELNGGAGGYSTDGYLRVAGYGNVPTNMGWGGATNAWNPRIGIAWARRFKDSGARRLRAQLRSGRLRIDLRPCGYAEPAGSGEPVAERANHRDFGVHSGNRTSGQCISHGSFRRIAAGAGL